MHNFGIKIDNLSKIEGHTNLDIKVRNGEVKYVKLKISENKRFYTQAIRNKPFQGVPQLVSRICGTCSIAHLTCCTEAIEYAFAIKPSEQTIALRKLLTYGMMIRDHAMHLYLFCLPDVLGKDSVLDFEGKEKEFVRKAFQVKGAGNNLSKIIGGRAVHATFEQIGYFSHIPSKEDVKKIISELKNARQSVIELTELFHKCKFSFNKKTNFVALTTDDYSFLKGKVCSSEGACIPEENYWDHLTRVVIPYSQATAFEFEDREYMLGALARMDLNRQNLHRNTKRDMKKYINVFPSSNIYANNLAQSIEILHSIDSSIELLEGGEFKQETPQKIEKTSGDGVGVIEAPRGTLYYMLSIKDGKINFGNIVVPTAQNQIAMENSIKSLVEKNLKKDRHIIEHEVEKLIRAFDPCMSCASHFLKVNWI